MFGEGDGAFFFVNDGGPLAAGDDDGGEPVHIEGEVIEFSEEGVGGDGAGAEDGEEVFGLGLDQGAGADEVEGGIFGGGAPAGLGGAGFEADDLVEDVLPGAGGDEGIAVAEVNAGEAEVHGGLLAGLVHGGEEAVGLGAVAGFEAGEGFGGVIKRVEDAFAAEEEAVTQFHVHASTSLARGGFRRLANFGRMVQNTETIRLDHGIVSQTVSQQATRPPKTLVNKGLNAGGEGRNRLKLTAIAPIEYAITLGNQANLG